MVSFRLHLAAFLAYSFSFAASVSRAAPPFAELLDRATGVLPSKDSFYALPEDLESVKAGTVLRHRPPPNPIAAFGVLPANVKASHQILYRTTDSLGNATATVLTVLVPHKADLSKVLSYQVAEDAASIDCAPSYAFQLDHQTGPDKGTMLTQAELLLVGAALERGWVVIVPDFLGPKGAFLANGMAGYATLDGIRAAINSGSFTGIVKNPTVSMWGYSGGSLASLWAAELQPSYAPELEIAGAAVGGTVPNITTAVMSVNGKGAAGLIPSGVVGLMNQYPELVPVVDKHLRPRFRDAFYKVRRQCLRATTAQFRNLDVVGMFDDRNLMYTNPTVVKILEANGLGKGAIPKIPLFVYKSLKDEISPIGETDALVGHYCAGGARIEYQRDEQSMHNNLAIIAVPKALSWLIATMEGKNQPGECVTRTVFSSLLDRAALGVLPKILLDVLLDLLGKPVGPLMEETPDSA
ncbi:hypothetical protein RJ55_06526 [Drechmeria coniospora]|nr:hypothetical protein RJ55_06526 [Drechmeria coniospora]